MALEKIYNHDAKTKLFTGISQQPAVSVKLPTFAEKPKKSLSMAVKAKKIYEEESTVVRQLCCQYWKSAQVLTCALFQY